MRIARDGTWFHEGVPIRRPAMVRLFSTVLRREPDGRHVLVTPVEKLDIEVEGAPFRATQMRAEGEGRDQSIAFALDSGDAIILGPDHPLRMVETERALPLGCSSVTVSKPNLRGRSITSLRSWRYAAVMSRPASGASARSFRWTRR